jgi:hypothetical protein
MSLFLTFLPLLSQLELKYLTSDSILTETPWMSERKRASTSSSSSSSKRRKLNERPSDLEPFKSINREDFEGPMTLNELEDLFFYTLSSVGHPAPDLDYHLEKPKGPVTSLLGVPAHCLRHGIDAPFWEGMDLRVCHAIVVVILRSQVPRTPKPKHNGQASLLTL